MAGLRKLALSLALAASVVGLAACGSTRSDEEPQKLLEGATLAGLESGEIELSVHAKTEGGGDHVDASVKGPIRRGNGGGRGWPELALTAEVDGRIRGRETDFKGGVTVLSNRAYVDFQGTVYEIDPGTFELLGSNMEKAIVGSGEEGASDGLGPCVKTAEGLELEGLLDNLKNEGSAEVDGTSTTKVSGDLDVGSAVGAIAGLAGSPACRAQIEAVPWLSLGDLEQANSKVDSVKEAHVEIYVGDDDIIRKVLAEVAVEDKSGKVVDADVEFTLKGVNEDQDIAPPDKASPLVGFYKRLNLFPLVLLETLGSEGGIPGFFAEITLAGAEALSSESGSPHGTGQ